MIEQLKGAISIPSVSTQGRGIPEMATFTTELLQQIGMEVSQFNPPTGNPILVGIRKEVGSKSFLMYNHYDVQPEEPLELWESEPFELIERDGKWFGRGIADNKGNIIARWEAIRQAIAENLPLPTLIWLIEGEEEIGSPNMEAFVRQHQELLQADACLWESGGVNWEGRPVLTLGCKGILYLQLTCRTLSRDVHSSMASLLPSPVWRLISVLRTLKDERDEILLPGFYDDVILPTENDLKILEQFPLEEERMKESYGISEFQLGLQGIEAKKRLLFSPSLNICGIWAGYIGQGSKTILPATAQCKIDFRLVPNQEPAKVLNQLRAHLNQNGFADVHIEVMNHGEKPARTPAEHPFVHLFAESAETIYQKKPVLELLSAGTGPMAPFREFLHVPIISFGAGYPDSRAHSPNENIRISDFYLHIQFLKHLFSSFTKF